MRISRREFLKYCTIAAGALGLTTTDLLKIDEAFAKVGDGGPHVVWLPGQACTGCTMSLANSIKDRSVENLLLFDIDLDYNEQLCASAGDLAVGAAVSAIGKTTVLALEGAIPHGGAGDINEEFCTIWTRTGGILAYASDVVAAPGALADGVLVGAAPIALAANDVIKAGSELVAGTVLPAGTIVADADDRAAMTALGASFNTAISSLYGTDRTNANVTVGGAGIATVGTVEITGGTDGGGTGTNQGSVLATGTILAAGTVATSSFDRIALSTVGATTPAAAWTYAGSANNFTLNATVTLNAARAVSGPMVIAGLSTIAAGSSIKTGSRVPGAADQTAFITNSGIATLFNGYGTPSSSVFTLAGSLSIVAPDEIVLKGDVTLPPLTGGFFGGTAAADKSIMHEANVFGSSAAAILCIGTCSSFGGIPAAAGNLTGASGLLYKGYVKAGRYNGALTQYAAKTINIGGCPPHSDWIVGTIAYLLATNFQMPALEAYRRPMDYFGQYQCNAGPCEWRYNGGYVAGDETSYDNPKGPITGGALGTAFINSSKLFKQKWGNSTETLTLNRRAQGCIGVLGCKGRKTKADCSLRRWNAANPDKYGTGWCVASGAGCHGCTEPTFPDKVGKFFNFA